MLHKIFITLLSLSPTLSLAQFNQSLSRTTIFQPGFKEIYFISDARYDHIFDDSNNIAERVQGRMRIGFTYDITGKFELIGLASTGNTFANDWFNIHDLKSGQSQPATMVFRQLYLQRTFGQDKVQLGSFGGFRTVGAAGITSTSGYVAGVKYMHPSKYGDLQVILGSIDASTPDMFSRKYEANYMQVELDSKVMNDLVLQSRYDHFNGNDYLNEQVTFSPEIFGQKLLTLMAEELYKTQDGSSTYEIGAKYDLLGSFKSALKNRFVVDVYYAHLDEKMHDRNMLNSAYFQDGNMLAIRASGAVDKKGNLTWYARDSMGKQSRVDVGFGLNIHSKKQ